MISSLLHLVGLRPRVYYSLTNFRGGGQGPLAPPPQYANVMATELVDNHCCPYCLFYYYVVFILTWDNGTAFIVQGRSQDLIWQGGGGAENMFSSDFDADASSQCQGVRGHAPQRIFF